jgi:hypothetical protein
MVTDLIQEGDGGLWRVEKTYDMARHVALGWDAGVVLLHGCG